MNLLLYERLVRDRVLPIIRTGSPDAALALGKRLSRLGFGLLEVSWTTPGAAGVVRELARRHDGVGAGTVVTRAMAEEAMAAGAQYLIAPNFSAEVSDYAHRYDLPYLPGVFTPTEVAVALDAGWTWLKLFPGLTGGPNHLQSLREVYPHSHFVPTGGVVFPGGDEWLAAGAEAVGVGSALRRLTDDELSQGLAHLGAWRNS